MALLPSGIHFCIDSQPLDTLIQRVVAGHGLHLPDLLQIHHLEDLRRHMRLLWLLPLGGDCAVHRDFDALSEPVPDGLTKVDSGCCMDKLPGNLGECDCRALVDFWESRRCRSFLSQQLTKVRQSLDGASVVTPEFALISRWFAPLIKVKGSQVQGTGNMRLAR